MGGDIEKRLWELAWIGLNWDKDGVGMGEMENLGG